MEKNSIAITKTSVIVFLYFLINGLFVFKYSLEKNIMNPYLSTFFYITLISGGYLFFNRLKDKEVYFKYGMYSLITVFFAFTIWLNVNVDKYALFVDRWSAMDRAINALLNNKYPYTAIDHMGGRTSNLPGLFLIGLPFYLLGDVGYLQCFSFLLFTFLIITSFTNNKSRCFALLMLIGSVAYQWEIFVKSDLMSNMIIILFFVVMLHRRIETKGSVNILILAIVCAILLQTRVVAFIPLGLLLFGYFVRQKLKEKIIFIVAFIFISAALLFLVFKNCDSINTFQLYNPFVLQFQIRSPFNKMSAFTFSLLISAVLVIFICITSFYYVRGVQSLLYYTIFFLSIPVFLWFIVAMYRYMGHWDTLILNRKFDISYFNILSPFIIYYLSFLYNKQCEKRTID